MSEYLMKWSYSNSTKFILASANNSVHWIKDNKEIKWFDCLQN